MKLLVFGNSGSGKSTLARALSERYALAPLDLDTVAWKPDTAYERQAPAVAAAAIHRFCDGHPRWVVEGCYADLLRVAAPRATHAVFLNPGVEACQANCRARPWEPHKYETAEAQNANLPMLLDWVAAYETRDDEFSLAAHRALFDAFDGRRVEWTSNAEVQAGVDALGADA